MDFLDFYNNSKNINAKKALIDKSLQTSSPVNYNNMSYSDSALIPQTLPIIRKETIINKAPPPQEKTNMTNESTPLGNDTNDSVSTFDTIKNGASFLRDKVVGALTPTYTQQEIVAKQKQDENDRETGDTTGFRIKKFLGVLGAGMAGQNQAQAAHEFDNARDRMRMEDPNSRVSKLYQKQLSPIINTKGLSAWELRNNPYMDDMMKANLSKQMLLMRHFGVKPLREPNEGERKNLGFYDRMKASDEKLDQLTSKYIGNEFQSPEFLGNRFKSAARQLAESAKRDWMIANLRKESGAAISPDEFSSQDITYFPQPGDTTATIEEKAKMREQVRRNTLNEAGAAAYQRHSGGAKK